MAKSAIDKTVWKDTHKILEKDSMVTGKHINVCKEVMNEEKGSWKGKRFLKIKPMILLTVAVKKRKLQEGHETEN
jgi:hypothetical protein